jgi:hypothetical protein
MSNQPSNLSHTGGRYSCFLNLNHGVKPFQDRRAPWYLCGLIRKPLRNIGVILLHNVEHCFLGEIAMVLGK